MKTTVAEKKAVETTLIGDKTREEVANEIKKATTTPANLEMEAALGAAIDKADQKAEAESAGTDLEFSPEFFVKFGLIQKKNVRIVEGFVADMQTINQKQRMLAEMLVKAKFKNMHQDNVYAVAIEAAILAVAITRVNNKDYPIPDIMVGGNSPEYIQALEGKAELFSLLLNASGELITLTSLIYTRLENADALVVGAESSEKK